jgi:pimeloyl-ACP methyl ester carboxylesterase
MPFAEVNKTTFNYRFDSRGHGHSAVTEGPYSMELLAADAVGLMDALGLLKVHFCGLSKGGMIGRIRLASTVEKIRRVILNTPVQGFCACCAAIRDMDQKRNHTQRFDTYLGDGRQARLWHSGISGGTHPPGNRFFDIENYARRRAFRSYGTIEHI